VSAPALAHLRTAVVPRLGCYSSGGKDQRSDHGGRGGQSQSGDTSVSTHGYVLRSPEMRASNRSGCEPLTRVIQTNLRPCGNDQRECSSERGWNRGSSSVAATAVAVATASLIRHEAHRRRQ